MRIVAIAAGTLLSAGAVAAMTTAMTTAAPAHASSSMHQLESAIVSGQTFGIDQTTYVAQNVPGWFHAQRASRRVALDACGRWPKFGLGENKRGQIVPGVIVSAPHTDAAVYCEDGHVSLP